MKRPVVASWLASTSVLIVALQLAACSGSPATPDAAVGSDAAVDAAVDASVVVDTPAPPPSMLSISPALGSVKGGTLVTIEGAGFQLGAAVAIGGVPCSAVTVIADALITCTTGDSQFTEGAMSVFVTNPDGQAATLADAFTYQCPWTTSLGRRSCGAVPPQTLFADQIVSSWITQFEAGHGFVANTVATTGDNLDDTSDAVLGTQSAVIETTGTGIARTLTRTGLAPIDFTDHVPKLWVKLDNASHATTLQLVLGDSNLANSYRFAFHSTQAQRWTTEGDWVAFTMSWSAANVTVQGTPNRAAITDVQLRVIDDATGERVRLHVNGIALVAEPAAKYPGGVLSITFDDGFGTMVSRGLPALAAHGYPATAYVIADLVDDPGRVTLAELHALQNDGWEIAVHSFTDAHHAARFTQLPADVLENDLVDARAWLIANGFAGYDHCAYPGGAFTGGNGTNVLALTRTYFSTCRTIYEGERETYPPADARKLRVFYVTNAVPLAKAIAAVNDARAHREWIILVFHQLVTTTPAVSTEWNAADFAALVAHIATTGMPVKTIGQVLTD